MALSPSMALPLCLQQMLELRGQQGQRQAQGLQWMWQASRSC